MTSNNLLSTAEPDWESIILQLTAYTEYLFSTHHWFRGDGVSTSIKGKTVDDYVKEAIKYHLCNPTKYNPEKGSLINYLKYFLIRRYISNDSKSSENALYIKYVYGNDGAYEIDIEDFGVSNNDIENNFDVNKILDDLELSMKDDQIVSQIFIALGCGYKKNEICEELNISKKEYDNGIRRLRYQAEKIKEKYK